MKASNKETKLVKYRCPECGCYTKPYFHNRKGIAFCICKKCSAQYKTNTEVSKNFRKYSAELGHANNRSQGYFTSTEKKVKEKLEEWGYREGIDYIHNPRVKNTKEKASNGNPIYYWLDFLLPKEDLVIEVDPKIWHKIGDRDESDKRKYEFLESVGLRVVSIAEKNLNTLKKYVRWTKE